MPKLRPPPTLGVEEGVGLKVKGVVAAMEVVVVLVVDDAGKVNPPPPPVLPPAGEKKCHISIVNNNKISECNLERKGG